MADHFQHIATHYFFGLNMKEAFGSGVDKCYTAGGAQSYDRITHTREDSAQTIAIVLQLCQTLLDPLLRLLNRGGQM